METQHTQTASTLHADHILKRLGQAITQVIDVEKIICFGSFTHYTTRKSCFEETVDVSRSLRNCYSLLVVPLVSQAPTGVVAQQQVEEIAKPFAEVTALVHSIEEVNAALQNGSTFFSAIYKKGALLFDRNTMPFTPPGPGKPIAQRIARREEFWNKWHDLAKGFLRGATFYQSIKMYNLAVYMLYQAAQHGYRGALRVMVGYHAPAQHLHCLLRLIDAVVPQLSLPRQMPADNQLVDILTKSHGEAHHNDSFEVSEVQTGVLIDRVERLIDMTDAGCRQRIKQLKDREIAYA